MKEGNSGFLGNPFNPAAMMSYVIPGGIVLISYILCRTHAELCLDASNWPLGKPFRIPVGDHYAEIKTYLKKVDGILYCNSGFLNVAYYVRAELENFTYQSFAVLISLFLFGSYVIGAVVAAFSALALDRILVGKILDFPVFKILKRKNERSRGKERGTSDTAYYYMSLYCLFYVALIAFLVDGYRFSFSGAQQTLFSSKVLGVKYGILIAIGGVALFVSVLHWLSKKLNLLLFMRCNRFLFQWVFLGWSFDGGSRLLKHLMDVDRNLPEPSIREFRKKFDAVFGVKYREHLNTDVFWAAYFHVIERSVRVRYLVMHWALLSTFLRNIAGAFIVAAILVCLISFRSSVAIYGFTEFYLRWLIILSIPGTVRWYYIYYNYFSKSVFRAFIYLDLLPESDPPNEMAAPASGKGRDVGPQGDA